MLSTTRRSRIDDFDFTAKNTPKKIHVLDNDTDIEGTALFITSTTDGEYGSVTITDPLVGTNGTRVTYTPTNSTFAGALELEADYVYDANGKETERTISASLDSTHAVRYKC